MMSSDSDTSWETTDVDFPPASVKHHDDVLNNFKRLREDENFNDFKISLQDGDVFVNLALMSKACDYFNSVVDNDKFLEGKTRELPMKEYGTQKAMELFAQYVYYGEMNFHEIECSNLLEIMNISRMMLMRTNKLFQCIENYFKANIVDDGTSTEDSLRGLLLVSKYRLDTLRKVLVGENYLLAAAVDNFSEESLALLQQFPVELVKEVLLFQCEDDDPLLKDWRRPTTGERFKYFLAWYSKNKDCGPEDKKAVLDSFKLDDFTGVELLTVAKESGFYSEEEIEKKCLEKFIKFGNCKDCQKCQARNK